MKSCSPRDSKLWQGTCWYRKMICIPNLGTAHFALLKFNGAMNIAEVWVNGRHVTTHQGGFLPFCTKLTDRSNLVAVRLDNTDSPVTGPRPSKELDFIMYSGLYRPVDLIIKNRLHITDPITAGKPAGGGLFITFPAVTPEQASIRVKTHIQNLHTVSQTFCLKYELVSLQNGNLSGFYSDPVELSPETDQTVTKFITVRQPELWDLDTPNLYRLTCSIEQSGEIIDTVSERIGIRQIDIRPDGFFLNGAKRFLRGVNRHQEYPVIGYALPDNAQYRDAEIIKNAGFDYIRLSHYPQSPAFMSACDELGLVVMNCIPGWQYFNDDPAFSEHQYSNCRTLIRRDRNHPCVILWEVSLNETGMPDEFTSKTRLIAHEELPDGPCFTCGWEGDYDVFIQARQHGGCKTVSGKPCVVSEYGDWEYYACNDGLDQQKFGGLYPPELNSRQGRGDGESRMLRQAKNFQEAHSDNLQTPAFADGLWVMFDYYRGYTDELEKSGCMDIYRIPKFSMFFFRSQRSPATAQGPMVFIANEYTPDSPLTVSVFSNADEVELFQNGRSIGRHTPYNDPKSTHLPHPPFIFQLDRYEEGTLNAVAYIHNREVSRHTRITPENSVRLTLQPAEHGRPPETNDVIFIYAAVTDRNGTVIPGNSTLISFSIEGPGRLIGPNPVTAENGIAPILLKTGMQKGHLYIRAVAKTVLPAHLSLPIC